MVQFVMEIINDFNASVVVMDIPTFLSSSQSYSLGINDNPCSSNSFCGIESVRREDKLNIFESEVS